MYKYVVNTTTPQKLWPAGNKGTLLLTNTDKWWPIYISDLPSGNGYALTPGASISWDSERPLYATVDDGVEAELVALENGGSLFSPSAIADALTASGLSSSIASQMSLLGVPPIDVNYPFIDLTIGLGANTEYRSATFDASRYQSLILFVYDDYAGAQHRTVTISFGSEKDGSSRVIGHNETSFDVRSQAGSASYPGSHASAIVPVRGRYLDVRASACANASNLRIIVVGSYKAVPKTTYQFLNHEWITDLPAGATPFGAGSNGFVGFIWNAPATGILVWTPKQHSGTWKYVVEANGATGHAIDWTFVDPNTLSVLMPFQRLTGPGQAYQTGEIVFPAIPCAIYVSVVIAPTSHFRIALTNESY